MRLLGEHMRGTLFQGHTAQAPTLGLPTRFTPSQPAHLAFGNLAGRTREAAPLGTRPQLLTKSSPHLPKTQPVHTQEFTRR